MFPNSVYETETREKQGMKENDRSLSIAEAKILKRINKQYNQAQLQEYKIAWH